MELGRDKTRIDFYKYVSNLRPTNRIYGHF